MYIDFMKLYSKNQLITVVICCVFVAIVLTCFVCFKVSSTFVSKSGFSLQDKDVLQDFDSVDQNEQFEDEFIFDSNLKTVSVSDGYTQDEMQNIFVYEKCSDAVVNISTKVMQYDWFFEAYPTDGGIGSGAIIDKRGYVVTNRHVIKDAYKIYISLANGTQYEGKLVGADSQTDIAVIKFEVPEKEELTTISFADSAKLKIGQKVIAIGNPFGFDRTMTTGIISSLGRPIQSNNTIMQDMIQTDTAINPGNSGGPLLDSQGRMIGINTMIYSNSGNSAGVGFAVPVNTAKRIVSDLMRYGKVRRGRLNISVLPVTPQLSRYANLSITDGILISEVQKGSNAEKAGLKGGTEPVRYARSLNVFYLGGDIITAINGKKCSGIADYNSALEATKPGETAVVRILRGQKIIDLTVVLEEANGK